MSEPVHDELIRLSLKRNLSTDDRARLDACLAAHPELKTKWNEDAAIGRALGALPNAPVSSNFTSRVLQAIDLEQRKSGEHSAARPTWRKWLDRLQPRLTWAFALLLAAGLGAYQYHAQQRARLTQDVQHISRELASLPGPEVFRDFDAIDSLRQVAVSDDDLLKVLQQQ